LSKVNWHCSLIEWTLEHCLGVTKRKIGKKKQEKNEQHRSCLGSNSKLQKMSGVSFKASLAVACTFWGERDRFTARYHYTTERSACRVGICVGNCSAHWTFSALLMLLTCHHHSWDGVNNLRASSSPLPKTKKNAKQTFLPIGPATLLSTTLRV